jgi:Uma2 family endonuclease
MATATSDIVMNDYPTTDFKPMAETDWHRILMMTLIPTIDAWFAEDPQVYVSGNLLVFYVPGNKRKHVSPDVFVVKGVPKRQRPNFLVWEEGHAPCVVIELTSSTTRHEDVVKKFNLYQDVLKVREYFMFDPREDYLEPRLQGYRLQRGKYVAIRPVKGRFPSKELGLHLEENGQELRLYDPQRGAWLPTPAEEIQRLRAELARYQSGENGKKNG